MAQSFTVNFDDGTTHTYDNVPDDVTEEQVQSRAREEFPDRKVAALNAPTSTASDQTAGPSAIRPVAALQTAGHFAGQALQNPVVQKVGEGIAGYYGAKNLGKTFIDRYTAAQQAAQQAQAAQAVKSGSNVVQFPQQGNGYGGQQYNNPNYNVPTSTPNTPAPPEPTPPGKQAFNQMGRQLSSVPTSTPNPAPATEPPTAANFGQRISQMAQKYLPAAEDAMGTAGRFVSRFGGPIAAGIAAASPTSLNEDEDKLLAEKHALEQRMLQNKHDQEWSKYIQAKRKLQQK